MNATEYLLTTDNLNDVKNHKKFPSFKWTTFNTVIVYLKLGENQRRKLNILKLFKSLNSQTKTASSCATTWIKTNIVDKGYLERYPDKFEDVKGKGTQEFKGLYVDVEFFIRFVHSIAGLNGSLWFDGEEDWFEGSVKGWVYLIRIPQHQGTNIVKYGRTINKKNRWMIYLNKCPRELQSLGIEILAYAAVDNQSEAEDAIARAFDRQGWTSTEDGREFRRVNEEPEDVYGIAVDTFCEALTCIGCDVEHIEVFDEGEEVFRLKRDTQ